MAEHYLDFMATESVRRAQERYYGRRSEGAGAEGQDPLTEEEMVFIRARDSFYMATVTENGWPYVQHRGGFTGFLRVLGPSSLAFADYRGNRQMLTTGNLAVNDRVALFLMDYPERNRLKILGRARVEEAKGHPTLVEQLAEPEVRNAVERIFFIDVLSHDWNCSKFITPRYTATEIEKLVEPLQKRIAELEGASRIANKR